MGDTTQGQGTPSPLSVRAMAAALGDVTKSQVDRLYKQGMPRHSVEAARAWRAANLELSRTADSRIDRPPVQTPAGLPDPPAGDLVDDPVEEPEVEADENTAAYRRHRADRERVRSEREQLELDQLRGKLIDLEEAKRLAFTAFRSLRDAVLNVPARVKDQCAAESDSFKVEQLIEAELTAALDAFQPAKVLREQDDDDEPG